MTGSERDRSGSADSGAPPAVVEADRLTKRYGDVVAVDAIDLEIPAGAVYGFLGPNGAGKTTTIEMLTTLTAPTAGRARVAGHPTTDRDAVKPHVGYLPDEPPVYEAYSAREQLEYVATLRGIDDERAGERIERLLERVDLREDADRLIDAYSRGMRQKVGLVQAVLHEPAVLFLDEPTTGLDPRMAREVVDLIDELADAGTTVFLSTHILPVVDELADRVGVLREGALVAEGSPGELKRRQAAGEERTLERAFLEITDDASRVAGTKSEAADAAGDR